MPTILLMHGVLAALPILASHLRALMDQSEQAAVTSTVTLEGGAGQLSIYGTTVGKMHRPGEARADLVLVRPENCLADFRSPTGCSAR